MSRFCIFFSLSGRALAIPGEHVREIVPMADVSTAPAMPGILEGFLNLGGAAIPVMRLDRLFDWPEPARRMYSCVIIMETREAPLGFFADEAMAARPVPSGDILPCPQSQTFNGCVAADIDIDGRRFHLLSPARVLLEQESRRIAEFQVMEQKRLNDLAKPRA